MYIENLGKKSSRILQEWLMYSEEVKGGNTPELEISLFG
jgi:hypothetical protein